MNAPFPRTPDGLPNAWRGEKGRFTPQYEARAEALWKAAEEVGLVPDLAWAGGEDGEALIASERPGGELVWVTHLEDPAEQAEIDRHIAARDLPEWMRRQISADADRAR